MNKEHTSGISLKEYFAIKERLNAPPKKKISISIDELLLGKAKKVIKKHYPNATISRLMEEALFNFLSFHHHEEFENKSEDKKE